MDLTVGLVNYNTKKYLPACLESIHNPPPRVKIEVVMVDNASTDGSLEWVREHYPQVRLLPNRVNVGIARGNNQVIQAAQARYVFLLNTDTILRPGAIDRLVDFLDAHPEVAAVGGKLVFEDDSFQSSYDSFPTLWMEFLGATQLGPLINPRFPSNPDCDEVRPVDWISSASLVVRKSAVVQVGYVDENFFIYGDETDLQLRLHRAGWKIFFLPDVKTVHFGGRSLDRWRRRRLVYRGKLIYHRKNHGRLNAFVLRLMYILLSFGKLLVWLVARLFPQKRERAQQEMRSNLEVIKMCFQSYDRILNEFAPILGAA